MKKSYYYSRFRRGASVALFLVLGGLFAALGTIETLYMNRIWGIVFISIGVLLIVVPQFSIHARYSYEGGAVRYNKGYFSFVDFYAKDVPIAIITVYDSYRQWKGYRPAYTTVNGEKRVVPALVLTGGLGAHDLELCDTRTNAKVCCKKDLIAEMYLDFRFFKQLIDGGFQGQIYISEPVYLSYKEEFDAVLGDLKDSAIVFRRTAGREAKR